MSPTQFLMAVFVVFLPAAGAEHEGLIFPQQRGATGLIEVDVGQEFALVLGSNPSTGYRWQFAEPLDEAVLAFVGSEYRPPEANPIGAGGPEIWTFRAVGRGATTISLKYIRPWETDVPPARTATFPVVVR